METWELGSVSSIFLGVRGISARRVRYDTRPLLPLGCLHVNKVNELGNQTASAPNQICSELRTLRNCLLERVFVQSSSTPKSRQKIELIVKRMLRAEF